MPVGIGGTNFSTGRVEHFEADTGVSLNFSAQNIPLAGSITINFNIDPASDTSTPTTISNPFPFTVN